MKRITALLLAAVIVFGSAAVSHADGIDLKVKGVWDFSFGWATNSHFKDNVHRRGARNDDHFSARHRIRTQLNFISSESLQGVLMFEIGVYNWGRGGSYGRSSGGQLDSDGVNLETKRAYLDWVIPNTEISVRMGIQGITLPSTPMGTPLFDADVAGVVVSSPITDWLSVTGFWLRPFDQYANDGNDRHFDDEVDIFGLLLPFSGDGWSFTPWGMYAFVGANSGMYDYLFFGDHTNTVSAENSSTKGWWVGAHLELSLLDPLIFNIEGMYGRLGRADLTGLGGVVDNTWPDVSTQGWFVGATLDYKLDWGTPGIFGWYSSGDKENSDHDGKLGRLPALGADGGSFYPTSFGFAGSYTTGIATDAAISATGTGLWGVGAQIKDISFIEDLSHTIRVAYYRGTNDSDLIKKSRAHQGAGGFLRFAAHDMMYLTDKDSVIEVNFDHKYKIYENLTMALELGWLHLKSDEDVWGRHQKDENSNAWKAQVMFKYTF